MIVINGSFLAQPLTGVQRFAIEISKKLRAIDQNIIVIAPKKAAKNPFSKELKAVIIDDGCSFGNKQLWEQIALPSYLEKLHSPFLLNLGNSAPFFYHNQAVTLHDTAFLRYPEFFSLSFVLYYKATIPLILKNSKYIFTSSQFSKSEIIHFYGYADKTTVVSNAVSEALISPQKEAVQKNILCVGSLEPRKNLSRLVEAFLLLKTKGYRLVIIGDKAKIYSDVKIAKIADNSDGIEFVGRVDDVRLSKYYASSSLFVYPSVYEGFGLPPLEAQKFGCPVLASNIPPHIEVLGDSAIFCDPLNPKDIAQKIDFILQDSVMREKLISFGYKNSAKYDWNISAKKIYDLISGFANEK